MGAISTYLLLTEEAGIRGGGAFERLGGRKEGSTYFTSRTGNQQQTAALAWSSKDPELLATWKVQGKGDTPGWLVTRVVRRCLSRRFALLDFRTAFPSKLRFISLSQEKSHRRRNSANFGHIEKVASKPSSTSFHRGCRQIFSIRGTHSSHDHGSCAHSWSHQELSARTAWRTRGLSLRPRVQSGLLQQSRAGMLSPGRNERSYCLRTCPLNRGMRAAKMRRLRGRGQDKAQTNGGFLTRCNSPTRGSDGQNLKDEQRFSMNAEDVANKNRKNRVVPSTQWSHSRQCFERSGRTILQVVHTGRLLPLEDA